MNDAPHPALLPAGLYDLLPPEAEIEAAVTARLMGVLAAHGYERVKPPLVEFEETLLSGAGTAMASDTFRTMDPISRSEEHTSELQSPYDLVCRLLLEKKKKKIK